MHFIGANDLSRIQQNNSPRYPYLLESPSGGPNGRYDILFGYPGDLLELTADNELHLNGRELKAKFFDQLEQWVESETVNTTGIDNIQLPFSGGWFLFLSYEMVREIEPTLEKLP
ncbi:MAG: hypothetical protein V3S12_02420, partial [Acidiferrobacterales bacterium]